MEAPLGAENWPDGRKIKFARLSKNPTSGEEFYHLVHPRTKSFEFQKTKNASRLVVGVPSNGTEITRILAHLLGGPHRLLYVLIVSRVGSSEGRYELKNELDGTNIDDWLNKLRDGLDNDGRHSIWIKCGEDGLVIYDRHDLLFVYGDLDEVMFALLRQGYEAGEVLTNFRHQHNYWPEYDALEGQIVASNEFRFLPLEPNTDI